MLSIWYALGSLTCFAALFVAIWLWNHLGDNGAKTPGWQVWSCIAINLSLLIGGVLLLIETFTAPTPYGAMLLGAIIGPAWLWTMFSTQDHVRM